MFPYPDTAAYLSENGTSAKAVLFATARSPVLEPSFFETRGIKVPQFVAPMSLQIEWYKQYLKSSSDWCSRFVKILVAGTYFMCFAQLQKLYT